MEELSQSLIKTLQNKIKDVISEKRYIHSLGVQYTAASLAMIYDVDILRAEIAGILHDSAKALSDKEILKECKKLDLSVSEVEKQAPSNLLHAKVGAVYAKRKYDIDDEEIISAIRWHTTGKPEMSTLEKIIFVADYIEPGRKMITGLTEVRKVAFTDIDKAVYLELHNTITYLEEKNSNTFKSMDEHTLEAYKYYKNIVENK